ncbi:Class I glutamine amidotransferase-like protein [Elaphomyces granulatus]
MTAAPRVLILMADYGHEPTETAVAFDVFKDAGFEVHFTTETGNPPKCDDRMLYGVTGKILGANKRAVDKYHEMIKDPAVQKPLAWSDPDFSLLGYDLLYFPGGHEKSVQQIIDSASLHKHVADYFSQTRKPSRKTVAAICHGVQVLSMATLPDGKSVLHDVTSTALPGAMESSIFWLTRPFLGDYYKTYGKGTDNVETAIKKKMGNPAQQYVNNLGPSPFVHEDKTYNYLSARFPPDTAMLAERAVQLVRDVYQS